MFGSVLNYVTLRLLGDGLEGGEFNSLERGRQWILDHGGATSIPSWGKFWLSASVHLRPIFLLLLACSWNPHSNSVIPKFWAFCHCALIFFCCLQVLGAFEWPGNNPLPPEIWMLPYFLPMHPGVPLFSWILHVCSSWNFLQNAHSVNSCSES